jgi:hypothetical protein
MVLHYPKKMISFQNLHKIVKRANPEMFCVYKLSLLLHKLYNNKFPIEEWTHLNFEQILTTRQTHFKITHNHNLMESKNAITIGCTRLKKNTNIKFKLEC